MIRNALLSTAAVAAVMSGSAFAADLPSRAAPAPYIAPAPLFTWTGFYVGLNAGIGFGNGNSNNAATPVNFTAPAPPGTSPAGNVFGNGFGGGDRTGFTGGGTVGYNFQSGAFVYGVEADFNYVDRGRRGATGYTGAVPAAAPYAILNGAGGSSSNFLGTVRARLGFAADRALFFVTGGFAYSGGGNNNNSFINYYAAGNTTAGVGGPFAGAVPTAQYTRNGSSSNTGYTLGGGIEYAFTNNWTAKLEYDYIRIGRNSGAIYTQTAGPVVAPGGTFFAGGNNRSNSFNRIIAGVNYKF